MPTIAPPLPPSRDPVSRMATGAHELAASMQRLSLADGLLVEMEHTVCPACDGEMCDVCTWGIVTKSKVVGKVVPL